MSHWEETPGQTEGPRWKDYIFTLARERLGILQEEVADVAREREVWSSLLELLPRDPTPDKRLKMDGWMIMC